MPQDDWDSRRLSQFDRFVKEFKQAGTLRFEATQVPTIAGEIEVLPSSGGQKITYPMVIQDGPANGTYEVRPSRLIIREGDSVDFANVSSDFNLEYDLVDSASSGELDSRVLTEGESYFIFNFFEGTYDFRVYKCSEMKKSKSGDECELLLEGEVEISSEHKSEPDFLIYELPPANQNPVSVKAPTSLKVSWSAKADSWYVTCTKR